MSNQAAAPSVGRIAASTAAITVSVVIPVRNGARYLRRTLPVLRRELPAGWEIVVVNDHSSDDSAEVARQFADRVLLSPVDGNDMDARNAGVTAARGHTILFLDADIRVTRAALEELVAGLQAPGVTMTVGIYSEHSDLETLCGHYKNLWVRYTYLRSARELRWMNTAFSAVRKADIAAIGYLEAFDGCKRGGSDIDFGRRIVEAGGRVLLMKEVDCDHLKEMSLRALLRNDYHRTRGFFAMAIQSGEIRRVAGGRSYGNISPAFMLGVVSVALVPAALLLAPFRPRLGVGVAGGALLVQQLCGLGFLRYAAPRLGARALLLPGIYFLDQLACAAGLAVEAVHLVVSGRLRPASTPAPAGAQTSSVPGAPVP